MPGFPATLSGMAKRRTVSATRTAGLLLVAVAWAILLALTGSPEAILFTVPVFLLAAPLAMGSYIGEEILAGIGQRRKRLHSAFTADACLPAGRMVMSSQTVLKRSRGRAPPLAAC